MGRRQQEELPAATGGKNSSCTQLLERPLKSGIYTSITQIHKAVSIGEIETPIPLFLPPDLKKIQEPFVCK